MKRRLRARTASADVSSISSSFAWNAPYAIRTVQLNLVNYPKQTYLTVTTVATQNSTSSKNWETNIKWFKSMFLQDCIQIDLRWVWFLMSYNIEMTSSCYELHIFKPSQTNSHTKPRNSLACDVFGCAAVHQGMTVRVMSHPKASTYIIHPTFGC